MKLWVLNKHRIHLGLGSYYLLTVHSNSNASMALNVKH